MRPTDSRRMSLTHIPMALHHGQVLERCHFKVKAFRPGHRWAWGQVCRHLTLLKLKRWYTPGSDISNCPKLTGKTQGGLKGTRFRMGVLRRSESIQTPRV